MTGRPSNKDRRTPRRVVRIILRRENQNYCPPHVPERYMQEHLGIVPDYQAGERRANNASSSNQQPPSDQSAPNSAPADTSAVEPSEQSEQPVVTERVVKAPEPAPVSKGFDARADAEALNEAMKGVGTNEKGLIGILCKRTFAQRVRIAVEYKAAFGQDLESRFRDETSGDLQKVLVALTKSRAEFLASELFRAMEGLGTNEATLIEVLCSGNDQEIKEINEAYVKMYNRTLEEDIVGDTSGSFKNLLVSLAQAHRDEGTAVDEKKVKEDAARLYQAGEARLGTDESAFNNILATRSWAHLRQLVDEYQTTTGNTLEAAVEAEFSFDAEKALLGILHCAINKPSYFAKRLNKALKALSTDHATVIRIIVSRSEIDLNAIKEQYQKEFGKSLEVDVMDKTSGDYQEALLSLMMECNCFFREEF